MADLDLILEELRAHLGPLVVESIEGFFEEGIGDLRTYGREIAIDFLQVEVLRMTDAEKADDLECALHGQLRVLAEANRLRLCQGSWDLVANVVRVLAKGIVAGAIVALGA